MTTERAPDRSKDTISAAAHRSTFDTEKINRAIERVARGDDRFIDSAIGQLEGLPFPAFKHKILEHARNKTQDQDVIGLFEGLDGYIAFRDTYHLRKAIEENGKKYKQQSQISDETRKRPNFARREIRGGSINEKRGCKQERGKKGLSRDPSHDAIKLHMRYARQRIPEPARPRAAQTV